MLTLFLAITMKRVKGKSNTKYNYSRFTGKSPSQNLLLMMLTQGPDPYLKKLSEAEKEKVVVL